jgi:hypothetical protein
VLVLPIGLCLGVFLPTILDAMKQRSPHLVPWAWGVNGFFSVIGAAGTILVAISFGFRAAVAVALVLYVLAAFLSRRLDTL